MINLLDLMGQRVLVSGASGALGGAAARALATMNADLVLTDLKAPEGLASELTSARGKVEAVALDNTDRESVDEKVASFGALDAFCDASGVYVKGDWVSGDDWEDNLERTLDINVRGPLNLVRAIMPAMARRGRGRIALTTSMAARNSGTTLSVEPAYVASKGALQALVRFFARQCAADGVVINAVAPGPIATPMTISSKQPFDLDKLPTRRFGKPEEVGWPLAFLCTPGCGYMTGVVIDINGGLHFS
ncbi:MAG: SDR family oxidoreductase [Rhizobiaceae bacterium]|nr:SDR family oxidoreductase [Rhizobiaceae bacterium]MCV0404949.1 SDR family oxidoreductase [Rhizobiaceae bacterium]